MFEIDVARVIGVWPYETAWSVNPIMKFQKDEEWTAFHRELAKEMGREPDNKEIYQVRLECGQVVCLHFKDCKVTLSLGVRSKGEKRGFVGAKAKESPVVLDACDRTMIQIASISLEEYPDDQHIVDKAKDTLSDLSDKYGMLPSDLVDLAKHQ